MFLCYFVLLKKKSQIYVQIYVINSNQHNMHIILFMKLFDIII